jgi:hypothetical protein
LCQTVPVRLLVSALTVALITTSALVGCSPPIDGKPVVGPKDVDQAYFFAGDVPVYGQRLRADDITMLAYLRALRRIDVCALLARDALPKVGETVSVGTLFAFDECDAEVKVSGDSSRRFVSVEVGMAPTPDEPPSYRVAGIPVYRGGFGSCEELMPLSLSRLPGAQPLTASPQPFVKVGPIGPIDCDLITRITSALAAGLATAPLPPRDAAAMYWSRLAERDPCEVLAVLPDAVDRWDVPASQPYRCRFTVTRAGRTLPFQVRLSPQLVDAATEGHQRLDQPGVEVYLDPAVCSAVAFVDEKMQRKLIGSGYADLANIAIRPAVVVDAGERDCDAVADVAVAAARLYG